MFVNRLPFYSPKALRTLMVVTAVLCGLAAIGLRAGIARSGSAGIKALPNVQSSTQRSPKRDIPVARRSRSGETAASLLNLAPAPKPIDQFVGIFQPFELDGNITPGAEPGTDDATSISSGTAAGAGLISTFFISEPEDPNDNQFTLGTKDIQTIDLWRWSLANVQDKNDILDGLGAAYLYKGLPTQIGGKPNGFCGTVSEIPANCHKTNDVLIYMGVALHSVSGATATSTVGIWLLRDSVAPRTLNGINDFTGAHTNGDILLILDISPGGQVVIGGYFWQLGANPDNLVSFINGATCGAQTPTALVNPLSCGKSNSATQTLTPPANWNYGAATISEARYGELGLNLSAAIRNTTGVGLNCFKSFIIETRNANSLDSSLNDFLGGPLINCFGTSAVELESFNATEYDGQVVLDWQTGHEVNNLGFNVYREERGKRVKINDSLLAGSALVAGENVDMIAGQGFSFLDNAKAGARYWLEDLDLNGVATWHGPFSASRAKPGLELPQAAKAERLRSLGRTGKADKGAVPVEPKASLPVSSGSGSGGGAVLDPARSISLAGEVRSTSVVARTGDNTVAGASAVKIGISHAGWYRVGQSQLVGAGLSSKVDPRKLQLFVDGQAVPIRVIGEADGRFDSADAIEFYGVGLDTPSTDTRVYWLIEGRGVAQRIATTPGTLNTANGANYAVTVERKDRSVYFQALKNGDGENWFGATVGAYATNLPMNLKNVGITATGSARLEVALQGVSGGNHQVRVSLNGQVIDTLAYTGRGVGGYDVPNSVLIEGNNTVTFEAVGPSDTSLVDYVRLTYQHTDRADDNALLVRASAGQAVSLSGFTNGQVRVLDVTNPDAVTELAAKVTSAGGTFTATAAALDIGERLLYFFASDRTSGPESIGANLASNWKNASNKADLVIITEKTFAASLLPLVELRRSQGLAVALVDIEDVYDEFSFGAKSPQAIKDLLAYARSNWTKAPRFVLLVGDTTFDPRDYLNRGNEDFVPTKLIDTDTMETASDDWFADFNNDGIPELAVGRLPVMTADEATRMVAKIVGYDQGPVSTSGVAMVSDANVGFDYDWANAQVREQIPTSTNVEEINRGRLGDSYAREQVLASINSGKRMINYTGHGSHNVWNGSILTSKDGASMTNSNKLSLFVTMTCMNGFFIYPGTLNQSLAESWLRSPGGAVAAWASSGFTPPEGQLSMDTEITRQLFSNPGITIGEATAKAKAAVLYYDVRRTWILFGDPTTRLR